MLLAEYLIWVKSYAAQTGHRADHSCRWAGYAESSDIYQTNVRVLRSCSEKSVSDVRDLRTTDDIEVCGRGQETPARERMHDEEFTKMASAGLYSFLMTFCNTFCARTTIMKVFALGLFVKPLTDAQRKQILPKEVPDTLRLYLDGKIDQFWIRLDKPGGVVFLMNSTSVEEAKSIIEALPLAANGYLAFEYIPVGPLQPLGLLIQSPQAE
jgi:hypothetical protein